MIEVTNIEEKKATRPKFVCGKYVGDEEMTEEQEVERLEFELAKAIAVEEATIRDSVRASVNEDVQELKSYEKSCCSCGCTTAIGNPDTGVRTKQRVFDSGMKVIQTHTEKVKIDIPREILNACDELQDHVGHNEFSIVCKGSWGENGNYVIGHDYKVPKQKVDGAAVDYDLAHLEELKQEGFNTVIHSHPFKSDWFSASDSETINSHFECSVLYSLRDFTAATIAISPISGTKLVVKGDPIVEGQNIVPQSELDNIEKKFKTSSVINSDHFWYGDRYNFRGAGKQDTWKDNRPYNERGLLTREVKKPHGSDTYTYDIETDTLWRNGVRVSKFGDDDLLPRRGSSLQKPVRVNGGQVQVMQVPRGERIFTTAPQTRIFNANDSRVEDLRSPKKQKGKRDNQPKIDLL